MAEIIVGEKIVNKLNQVGTILFILSDRNSGRIFCLHRLRWRGIMIKSQSKGECL